MMLRPLSVTVLGCFALAALASGACGGGSSTPPLAPDVQHPGGGGEANATDLVEADAGSGATASGPASGASAATGATGASADTSAPASTPAAPPEPKDECTPVGVDFEKRARPKLKDCYAQAKKKAPNLEGTVKISVDIDTLGKVKAIKIVEKTLPESVAQCMLKVVKGTPLTEASKCPGKTLTIPVTFPTPR
jgi:hypothetical protein